MLLAVDNFVQVCFAPQCLAAMAISAQILGVCIYYQRAKVISQDKDNALHSDFFFKLNQII